MAKFNPQSMQKLQFFEYAHLPAHLQDVSAPFHQLAKAMDDALPENAEKSAFFRKLMEAKDCAVRAALFKTGEQLQADAEKAIKDAKNT